MSDREYSDMRERLHRLVDTPPGPGPAREQAAAALREAISHEVMRRDVQSLIEEPAPTQRPDLPWLDHRPHAVRRWLPSLGAAAAIAAVVLTVTLVGNEPSALGALATTVRTLQPSALGEVTIERVTLEERLIVTEVGTLTVPYTESVEITERIDTDNAVERTTVVTSVTVLNDEDTEVTDRLLDESRRTTEGTVVYVLESDSTDYLTDSPDEFLATAQVRYTQNADPSVPFVSFLLDEIVSLYRTTTPTPPQRAAILEGLSRINGDIDETANPNDTVTVTYTNDESQGTVIRSLTFGRDGWLEEVTTTFADGTQAARVRPETTSVVMFLRPAAAPG